MADHEAKLEHHHEEDPSAHPTRRAVLEAAIAVGAGAAVLSTLYVGVGLIPKKEVTPETEPIAAGDVLVYSQGPNKNQSLKPGDLRLDAPQIIAYPLNPKNNVVKSGEANNTVIIVRLDPTTLDSKTSQYAVDGIVAYSGVCKHLGCIVSNWDAAKTIFVCPCHQGKYDPKASAKVVGGPPPGPVPQLPIKIEGDKIVVAAPFLFKAGKEA